MTVGELIAELEKIQDKSEKVEVQVGWQSTSAKVVRRWRGGEGKEEWRWNVTVEG